MGLRDYRPSREVTIDGETVEVRGLTVGESEAVAEQTSEDDTMALLQRRIVALAVYKDGARYFAGPDDVMDVNRTVMTRLFDVAAELSGLAEGAVEEAEKN